MGQVPYPLLGYWLGQTHPVTLLFRRCGPRLPHEVPRRPARQEGGGVNERGRKEDREMRDRRGSKIPENCVTYYVNDFL